MKNNNKPKLRYPEFTDAWEKCKLGEVAKRVKGNDGDMSLPTLTISAGSGWLDQKDRFSGNIAGSEQKNYTLLKRGQLSYNHGNSKLAKYGAVFVLRTYEKALVPRVYHSFTMLNNADADFIEFLFATKIPDKELVKKITSGARTDGLLNISFEGFMDIAITIPTLPEQQKIGALFRRLDRLITLHKRKWDDVILLKKALLQKMFPKNGSDFPALRFPEFTDAWEKCKLGEVANIIMGQSPSSEFYTNNPSDYILVQGNADIKNGWVTPRIWTTQITKMGKKGDLIFSVRAPVGEIGKTKYDVVLGRGVAAIQGNEFIFQTLGRMNIFGFWKSLSTGSTFDAINSSELKNVEIHLPTLPEQQKIGALFRRLDRLITLHKRKWDDVILLKKALLQKMFPKNGERLPEIRFPEFSGDWETHPFKKIAGIRKEHFAQETVSIDIELENLMSDLGEIVGDTSLRTQATSAFKKGDVLFGRLRPYLNKWWLADCDGVKSGEIWALFPLRKVSSLFLYLLVQSKPFLEAANVSSGSKMPRAEWKIIEEVEVMLPSLPEQQKIGTFFRRLDRLISHHQQQYEHYQLLKKALLQQMFI